MKFYYLQSDERIYIIQFEYIFTNTHVYMNGMMDDISKYNNYIHNNICQKE